jgi:hypothetical protein
MALMWYGEMETHRNASPWQAYFTHFLLHLSQDG